MSSMFAMQSVGQMSLFRAILYKIELILCNIIII